MGLGPNYPLLNSGRTNSNLMTFSRMYTLVFMAYSQVPSGRLYSGCRFDDKAREKNVNRLIVNYGF